MRADLSTAQVARRGRPCELAKLDRLNAIPRGQSRASKKPTGVEPAGFSAAATLSVDQLGLTGRRAELDDLGVSPRRDLVRVQQVRRVGFGAL